MEKKKSGENLKCGRSRKTEVNQLQCLCTLTHFWSLSSLQDETQSPSSSIGRSHTSQVEIQVEVNLPEPALEGQQKPRTAPPPLQGSLMGDCREATGLRPRVLAEAAWNLQHIKSLASPAEMYGYVYPTLSAFKTSTCPAFNLEDCSEQEVKNNGDLTPSAWEHLAMPGDDFGCHSRRML